ncbi:hypothetical protein [Nostoc sp.]|uniref:hypothetical protein n=1 Tax=Nostoc sp. TaxID=1180 RepID=UPI002FF72DA8
MSTMVTERLVSEVDAVPLAYGTLRERGSKLRLFVTEAFFVPATPQLPHISIVGFTKLPAIVTITLELLKVLYRIC